MRSKAEKKLTRLQRVAIKSLIKNLERGYILLSEYSLLLC